MAGFISGGIAACMISSPDTRKAESLTARKQLAMHVFQVAQSHLELTLALMSRSLISYQIRRFFGFFAPDFQRHIL